MVADPNARCRQVLVVEDEMSIVVMIENTLMEMGAEVVGPAAWLDDALQLAREESIDAAVLDINIQGGNSYPIADVLADRQIPFVFCSGYGDWVVENRHRGRPRLTKPFSPDDLKLHVLNLLDNHAAR